QELSDSKMIHQAQLVIGVGIPRTIDFQRSCRLAARRVPKVHGDAAVFAAELLHGIEGRTATEESGSRIQAAARNDQHGEAGTGFVIVDADIAFFIKRHVVSSSRGFRAVVSSPVNAPLRTASSQVW